MKAKNERHRTKNVENVDIMIDHWAYGGPQCYRIPQHTSYPFLLQNYKYSSPASDLGVVLPIAYGRFPPPFLSNKLRKFISL